MHIYVYKYFDMYIFNICICVYIFNYVDLHRKAIDVRKHELEREQGGIYAKF